MRKAIDLTGQKFNRLTVIKRAEGNKNKNSCWLVRCDCGTEKIVFRTALIKGTTKSCGCYNRELNAKRKLSHGKSRTRLYRIWANIKARCLNPNNTAYHHYGGRGIAVCDEWRGSFEAFYNWATANGYNDHLTIDRMDNSGNYEPSNCRWVTQKEQCNNTRQNHILVYNGEAHNMTEWAIIKGIKRDTLRRRLQRGWSIAKALQTPV